MTKHKQIRPPINVYLCRCGCTTRGQIEKTLIRNLMSSLSSSHLGTFLSSNTFAAFFSLYPADFY